jgi:hypothetical protein
MACTDFELDAVRFAVPASWLRLLVAQPNLDLATRLDIDSDQDPATAEQIRVQVWPAATAPLVMLQRLPAVST